MVLNKFSKYLKVKKLNLSLNIILVNLNNLIIIFSNHLIQVNLKKLIKFKNKLKFKV